MTEQKIRIVIGSDDVGLPYRVALAADLRTMPGVDEVIDGWPLIKERDQKVKPLGMWHVVECVNAKKNGVRHD